MNKMYITACTQLFGLLSVEVRGIEHTVTFSDTAIWTAGISVTYPDMTMNLGETLKFVSYSDHDVVLLRTPSAGTAWDQCGMQGIAAANFTTIWPASAFSGNSGTEKHYTPPTCGDFYIACSVSAHCAYGQRVKVVVKSEDGNTCAAPCVGPACVTDASKVSATSGVVRDVKPAPKSNYWGSSAQYEPLTVTIGDTVIFRTGAGFHDVATVPTSEDFNTCDMSRKTILASWSGSSGQVSAACNASSVCCADASCAKSGMSVMYNFPAATVGETFFVCTVGTHCATGQKLTLRVISATGSEDEPASFASHGHRLHLLLVLVVLLPANFL